MALTKDEVLSALRSCFDPEIPLNIVDLGLIYGVDVEPSAEGGDQCDVTVRMTLTSTGCPMSQAITQDVHRCLRRQAGVNQARVEIVWEPSWSPDRITPDGRRHLQIA